MNATPAARVRVPTVRIDARIPADVLDAIDAAASRVRLTRTAWIIQAAMHYLPPDLLTELERETPVA